MAQSKFKIPGGCNDAKFAYLETIIPRMQRRLGQKTFGIIPSSILTHYIKEVPENGVMLKSILFEGTLNKVCFSVTFMDGKVTPAFICSLKQDGKTQTVNFSTKKSFYIAEINLDVSDGDIIEILCTEHADTLQDIHMSVLMTLNQKHNKVVSELTDNLLTDVENETIEDTKAEEVWDERV